MRFFKRKRNIIIISIIIVLIIIISICSRKSTTLPVKTAQIAIGTINEFVRTSGKLEPLVDVEISSDIMGKALNIFVEEGSMVKKGDKLIQIDFINQKSRLREAQTSLDVAITNLEYKKFLLANKKELLNDSLISYSEFKIAELDYNNALSHHESAKSYYEISKDNMEKTLLLSPINGIVSGLYVEEGENIITGTMNNPGTVLMTISDNNQMLVKSDVDETSIIKTKKGNIAEIVFDAYPDTTFTGTVTKIANRPDITNTLTEIGTVFPVEILINGDYENLLSGMNCEVSIITESKDSIIKVPIQAVVMREGNEGIFTMKNNIAKFVDVKSGIIGKEFIEIESDSIEEDMKIIIGPFTSLKRLENNDRVTDREFKGKPGLSKGE